MKIDFNRTEGLITITADKRRGTWASQVLLRGARTVRTAGQISTEASAHSLLTVALLNSTSISRNQAAKLAPAGGKMRLVVLSSDVDFVAGINTLVRSGQSIRLKSGKNFVTALARKLDRFAVNAVVPEADDKSVLILQNWLSIHVFNPSRVSDLPLSLLPTVMSEVL